MLSPGIENAYMDHSRYYQIAGITIQVDADLPITDATFMPKFKLFEVDGPGEDTITIRHHFALPGLNEQDLGKVVHRQVPWVIHQKNGSWNYVGVAPDPQGERIFQVAMFSHDHTRAQIFSDGEQFFREGGLPALSLTPTDQILLARILADRAGCYVHSSGVVLEGQGLLFVGHSETGKSTMASMLKERSEILCDDRIIVRRWPEGFRVHGTWSHGDLPEVSSNSAPLRAILFLEQARENRVVSLRDKREVTRRLLPRLVRPLVTTDWWDKTFSLAEKIIDDVPCYSLRFDKSGRVVELLVRLLQEGDA
jgi:hypothetical protein